MGFAVGGEGEDRVAGQRTVAALLESRKWFLFSVCLLFSWPIRGIPGAADRDTHLINQNPVNSSDARFLRRVEPPRVSGDAWESVALHVYIARVGSDTPTRAGRS